MIINALIIIFLLWFLYLRFAPVKGIQQISTMELKAELKNKQLHCRLLFWRQKRNGSSFS